MNSKREFLKQSLTTMLTLGASALTAKGFAQKQPLNKPAAVANVQVKPIVVSTWQHGLAANQEA
jgi:N4-(beta-N-acetylglucosaminyl)-L-asparaginase